MKQVAVIDYGMCNLDSVRRAVEECGANAVITDRREDIAGASAVILPGVGVFADAMSNIRALHLDEILTEHVVTKQVPLLGICLGMQLLAGKGFECGETAGLGWIPGEVVRLVPDSPETRIPHVGWDEVFPQPAAPLFDGITPGRDFYFVHSYHFVPEQAEHVLATTPYCGGFISAVGNGSIIGTQFHPEKSQRAGFQVLKNFLEKY
jgi:glutamine amidotransferase